MCSGTRISSCAVKLIAINEVFCRFINVRYDIARYFRSARSRDSEYCSLLLFKGFYCFFLNFLLFCFLWFCFSRFLRSCLLFFFYDNLLWDNYFWRYYFRFIISLIFSFCTAQIIVRDYLCIRCR